ncbi:hypothetical protein M569_16460 [Genlisea aurea]|uniref:Mitochondrial transcription termination factor family protein n=1 Tax=Genlisea aurea TaxID=192259 RepID=S8BVK2_9LAMI|nr:hypothetical protein M569_16460 [Genlisea aurea]
MAEGICPVTSGEAKRWKLTIRCVVGSQSTTYHWQQSVAGSHEANAYCCPEGLKIAHRLKIPLVILESDRGCSPRQLCPIVEDLMSILAKFDSLRLSYVRRELNVESHCLAKQRRFPRYRNLKSRLREQQDDDEAWNSCKQYLSPYGFEAEEEEIILGKAFGRIHSPYWGEDREQQQAPSVYETLRYFKDGLGLGDEDVAKILKKFPELLGCSLDNEIIPNVERLKVKWNIHGKSLRKLLLRNPGVLGFNIDCEGDCQALCTRCWARF